MAMSGKFVHTYISTLQNNIIMKSKMQDNKLSLLIILLIPILFFNSCQRDIEGLSAPTYPVVPDVFRDGFSGGLNYAAFGGSVPTAFQVDFKETYNNSAASMRFEVPDVNDPRGAYAGGTFFDPGGRDLSLFNVLSFWVKSSKAANLDVVGFGNDLGANSFVTSINGLPINTNWQKYYIPIPDPAKLTQEKGMFFYSEGAEEGRGYTFWIDEVKFENAGTVGQFKYYIMDGQNTVVEGEVGEKINITGLKVSANLPTGIDQFVNASPLFYTFKSSNENIAIVDQNGVVTILSSGEATITATIANTQAIGAMVVRSAGSTARPTIPAPKPTRDTDKVLSLFSNVYPNSPVDTWNTRWQFSNAEEFFIQVQGDDVIRYRNLNFVGIEFVSNTKNISNMTHFHIDVWTPDPTSLPNEFKVLLVDFGPNNAFGGDDDSSHELTFRMPVLKTGEWFSLDIPLTAFTGMTGRGNLAQLVLSGTIPNVYIDNVYFYNEGGGSMGSNVPTVAAPAPIHNQADVISLFSDVYTNRIVDTWRTPWSVAVFEDLMIAGNKTKKYSNLDFVGIETITNQIDVTEMTHIRLDVWSPDFTFFAIKLVDFGPNGTFGGGDDTEHEVQFDLPRQKDWVSLDIPLSSFTNLTRRKNISQIILVGRPSGNTTVYVDNIYFRK